MGHRMVSPQTAEWQVSKLSGVENCDLASQLGTPALTSRLWRLRPGEAIARHRHRTQTEVYVLLEGRGRLRVDGDLLDLDPMSAVAVDPSSIRQVFNDTDGEQLWLIFGAPAEPPPTADDIGYMYPDGAGRPPELTSGT